MITVAEGDYIKAIFKEAEREKKAVSTTAIASQLGTTPASVTDMLKKLSVKGYIHYERYKGVQLTADGNKIATNLIRKHRLWEVFLADKLRFSWDKVHDLAEQLEHIESPELVSRLDAFLDYPKYDPHGDPIPNADGKFTIRNQFQLSDLAEGYEATVVGVKNHDASFLKYLDSKKIKIGSTIKVLEYNEFDKGMLIMVSNKNQLLVSNQFAQNLLMKKSSR